MRQFWAIATGVLLVVITLLVGLVGALLIAPGQPVGSGDSISRMRSIVGSLGVESLGGIGDSLEPLGSALRRAVPAELADTARPAYMSSTPPTRDAAGETERTSLPYRFHGRTGTIELDLAEADLRYDTDIGVLWTRDDLEDRRARVRDWVLVYADTPMVESIASQLRTERSRLGLDSDEYLELIAAVVQQIPYGTEGGTSMRSPVRVAIDRTGDCDEKSVLLAAIMVHEGYDTALLEFNEENHLSVGVRSKFARYPGSSFAIVESTQPSYIGEAGRVQTRDGAQWLRSTPVSYAIAGSTEYGAGKQVNYILQRRDQAKQVIDELKAQAQSASASSPRSQAEADAANAVIGEYNAAVDVYGRTVDGVEDRTGVYKWLRAHP